jgi:hypothetical protein
MWERSPYYRMVGDLGEVCIHFPNLLDPRVCRSLSLDRKLNYSIIRSHVHRDLADAPTILNNKTRITKHEQSHYFDSFGCCFYSVL